MSAAQVSADPRARRRRTLHPDQRALPINELAAADAVYGFSFIVTNLDVSTGERAVRAAPPRQSIKRRCGSIRIGGLL